MHLPTYLHVPADELGRDSGVTVRITRDRDTLAAEMAQAMFDVLRAAQERGGAATLIVPVGPVDQFPLLAELIRRQRLDCRQAVLINMDEYLDEGGRWVPLDHPLSFRGYMQRAFYDLLPTELAPLAEHRVFPDPRRTDAVGQLIGQRGGVDACFGGIGINGHMAFNEPPEPGEEVSLDAFADLPTRVLPLSRETRTINSVTVGGEISIIPRLAITVGMREILASRQMRFYCNRPWQRGVCRRVLHGPIAPACPASLMRRHRDAQLTVTEEVAEPPAIGLR